MPPAPSTNDKYLLKALSGRVNPPNNAFYASLTGQSNMLATAVHVLVALLGHCLKKQTASPDFLISLRLCIYIFVPYMLFDETADALTLPFFPLPLTIATFLQRLVKAGMPTERVSDKRAARELVGYWALKLPRDRRTFDASDFVQITTQPDNFLMHVTPPMARTTSESNAEVVTFLCLLQGGFTDAEANTATFTGFCVMLIPMGLPAGCPPQLTAVRSCSHVRSTSADPPHDMFTEYTDILSEITRRHEPTKEDRFKPLFDARFAEVYTTAAAAFPQTVHPAAMRDRLTALGVALGLTLDFTHVGVSALCSVLQPQLQSLEVDAPAASTPDDGRFSAILRLHRDQPGGRIAPTTNGSAADGWKPEAGENIKLLLEDTSYMSLYQEVLSLNTSNTSMASVVAVVARHAHAAGLIIMTSKRMLRQPAWEHVLGFRQKDAWQQAFDTALAVDSEGNSKAFRGRMLPIGTDKDATPHAAVMLLNLRLNEISDWHSLCAKHVELNEGKFVLLDDRFRDSAGAAFWRNPDVLRLDEQAMSIVMGFIGHDQSRSIAGSFRHFYFHQIARAERLRRLPKNILAYPNLVIRMDAAIADVLKGVAERHASMALRSFHLMQRSLFVPKGEQGEKAFAAIDGHLSKLKEEIEKSDTGEASFQALNLQTISSGGLVFSAGSTGSSISTSGTVTFPSSQASLDSAGTLQLAQSQARIQSLESQLRTATGASLSTAGKSSPYPTGIHTSWGDAAYRYGVARTNMGLVFGRQLVQCKGEGLDIPKGSCLASCATSGNSKSRSQWCVDTKNCKGYAAHDRPPSISADDLIFTELAETVDTSGFQWIVKPHPECVLEGKPIPAPKPTWPIETGPGTHFRKGGKGTGKGKGKSGGGRDIAGRKRKETLFDWPSSTGLKTAGGSEWSPEANRTWGKITFSGTAGLSHTAP